MSDKRRNKFMAPSRPTEPKGHPQFYNCEFGHEEGDFWVGGHIRARSPLKAQRKALRLQKKLQWPFMRVAALPSSREVISEQRR